MHKNKRVEIGIVPAVFLKLLDQQAHAYSDDEMLVIEAIKRSDKELSEATIPEISIHLSQYSLAQLKGFVNNVKGIYHEILFAAAENADGDNIKAELFEHTNHPGADVRLTNTETGEFYDNQLKATNSIQHITEHQEKYPDIEVLATQEVSEMIDGVESSGFSNEKLTSDVTETINDLTEDSHYIGPAVAMSGLMSAALNTKAALEGRQPVSLATRKTLEDMGIAITSAAIIDLLIG